MDSALILWLEKQAVDCSVCFTFHPIEDGTGVMVERYAFSSLREFLYVELGQQGPAQRQRTERVPSVRTLVFA